MLGALISKVQAREKTFTVYTADPDHEIFEKLALHGVEVVHRQLPTGPAPFVTIHDGDEFLGALQLADLETLLSPPIVRPGSREDVSPGYRALFDLLENSVFSSLERRQLLGVSREIEDRAFRVGHGTLRASFQKLSAFEAQTETYRHLAEETALDIHVYGEGDWTPPAIDGVTYHRSTAETVERFWVVAFDGGGDEMQTCALVAREWDDEYIGVWTYDPEMVEEILTALETIES